MPTEEPDAPAERYAFRATYGAEPSSPNFCAIVEPIHLARVHDAFVRDALGLAKEKRR